MPRFYFDVLDGDRLVRDDDGLELASLEAAEREAKRGAADRGRDSLPKDCPEMSVQVRDEHGERVLTLTVAMTVRRAAFVLAYAKEKRPWHGRNRHCGTSLTPTMVNILSLM
jgi:hypothetical protein